MIEITVDGTPFECGRSCETILRTGDTAWMIGGQIICPECALKETLEVEAKETEKA